LSIDKPLLVQELAKLRLKPTSERMSVELEM
jgi:hypothetical protein